MVKRYAKFVIEISIKEQLNVEDQYAREFWMMPEMVQMKEAG